MTIINASPTVNLLKLNINYNATIKACPLSDIPKELFADGYYCYANSAWASYLIQNFGKFSLYDPNVMPAITAPVTYIHIINSDCAIILNLKSITK